MDKESVIIIMVIAVIIGIIIIIIVDSIESFKSRPEGQKRVDITNQILANKELFNPNVSVRQARKSMPWLDAVLHEDVIQAKAANKFTPEHLNELF
jgi:hypothetical protein